MTTTQIGVVIPSLNGGNTIEWTLLSLLNQVGVDIQIVVVDSGSTDQTLEICRRCGVRVEYEPPGNLYRAVNLGIRSLNCEWITYLNTDDFVYSDSYARLIAKGEFSDADVTYGHTDYIDISGHFLYSYEAPPPYLLRKLFNVPIMGFDQPAAIFRKSTFEALSGFDINFRSIADLDFFFRAIHSKKKFSRLQRPSVAAFRLHDSQFSRISSELTIQEKANFHRLQFPSCLTFVSLWWWRILNCRQFSIRYLRTGSLRRR